MLFFFSNSQASCRGSLQNGPQSGLVISAEKYYLVPLTIALTVSLWGNLYQRNKYQGEIKRLTEIRKRLMHGLEKKELKEIKEHKTSNFTFKKD